MQKSDVIDAQEEKQYTDMDGVRVVRRRTVVEKDLIQRRGAAHQYISQLPSESQLPEVGVYIPQALSSAIFCGHLVTDLDSIAVSRRNPLNSKYCAYLLIIRELSGQQSSMAVFRRGRPKSIPRHLSH